MVFQSPGAIFLKFSFLTIRWYGVMIATGFMVATWVASRLAATRNVDQDKLLNCCLLSFIGGIVGARLYFVALNWDTFSVRPMDIMATWLGGLSIHGGIVGGLLTGFVYSRIAKINFATGSDIIGTVLPLGQAIGRWGNFFNSEAFGKPVPDNFPLKLFIPVDNRPFLYKQYSYFHPTFLYECFWDLLIFSILYFIVFKRLKSYPGLTFLTYIALYSVGRFCIEPLRLDSIMFGNVPAPSVVSAILFAFSLVAISVLYFHYRKLQKAP